MGCTKGHLRRAGFAVAVLCGAVRIAQSAPSNTNALWVYSVTNLPNPVTDGPTRTALLQNSAASGVNLLYVSVYSSTPNAAGRYLYDESDIASLITQAHTQGMHVYTAMGDPDWPSDGCAGTPLARFSDIAGYNSANPSATFDGIILDVEPGSNPDFVALLDLYQCFQQQASAAGIGLSAAISAFWTSQVTFNQITEPAYEQIVDLKMNQVVVMGYRNFAGTSDCTQGDGVVCLDESIVQYANSVSLANSILVGLNTDNPATSGDLPEETFYSLGQSALNSVVESVDSQFADAHESFGGFAINNYRDSYLNGQLSGWPATNPAFSTPSISLVGNAEGLSLTIAPNTWVEIGGSNLSPPGDSRTWQALDFVNNQMPVQLDGVSVTVNGISAYVYYISPTQVNILTPPDAMSGPVQVQVTNNRAVSSSFTVQAQAESPSFFVFNGEPYVAATHADGSLIGPTSLYPGSTTPAKPGETVVIYANGFGRTSIPVVSGAVTQSGTLSPLPVVTIGGMTAPLAFAGLNGTPGEFQFNVVIPSSLADGDEPITAAYDGLTTQKGTLITVQN
jgi:uncharacterized protein (TIGR03437 family)